MASSRPFPLASTWWRQHGVHDRLQTFRASRHPTPAPQPLRSSRRTPLNAYSFKETASTSLYCASDVPVILISACLMYYPVTFRGDTARLPAMLRPTPLLFLTEVLAREVGLVRCVPLCPEMDGLGLPAPRQPLRLLHHGEKDEQHFDGGGSSTSRTARDTSAVTTRCIRLVESGAEGKEVYSYCPSSDTLPPWFAAEHLPPLREIDGVVLKSRSPSCGVQDARLYSTHTRLPSDHEKTPPPPSCRSCGVCSSHRRNHSEDDSSGGDQHHNVVGSKGDAVTRQARSARLCTSDTTPHMLVDGFFTQLLRNSLDGQRRAATEENVTHQTPRLLELPPPTVITSDRLLRSFEGVVSSDGSSSSPLEPELTSLEGFMESVLRHRDWRCRNPIS